jgi:hypothetical protein
LKFLPATVAVAVCALAAGMSAQAASSAKLIKLLSVQQSQKESANGFVIRDNDFIGGKKAGRDTLTCKTASQQKANCTVLFVLSGGTIKGKFVIVFSKSGGQGTIVGGTGKYAGAKGKLAYRNLNEKGTRTAIVLTLT